MRQASRSLRLPVSLSTAAQNNKKLKFLTASFPVHRVDLIIREREMASRHDVIQFANGRNRGRRAPGTALVAVLCWKRVSFPIVEARRSYRPPSFGDACRRQ